MSTELQARKLIKRVAELHESRAQLRSRGRFDLIYQIDRKIRTIEELLIQVITAGITTTNSEERVELVLFETE